MTIHKIHGILSNTAKSCAISDQTIYPSHWSLSITWLTLLKNLNYTAPNLSKCLATECYQEIFVHEQSAQPLLFLIQPDVRSDKFLMPGLQVMAMDPLRNECVSKMLANILILTSLRGAPCTQEIFGCIIRHCGLQIFVKYLV
jgi:hypothetical protein